MSKHDKELKGVQKTWKEESHPVLNFKKREKTNEGRENQLTRVSRNKQTSRRWRKKEESPKKIWWSVDYKKVG